MAVSSKGAAGVAAPEMELNEMVEPPAATAARHGAKYCNNMHPVRARSDLPGKNFSHRISVLMSPVSLGQLVTHCCCAVHIRWEYYQSEGT